MENDDNNPESVLAFGSDRTLASVLGAGPALGSASLGPKLDSRILEDLLWAPKSDLRTKQFTAPLTDVPVLPLFTGTPFGPSIDEHKIAWENVIPPPWLTAQPFGGPDYGSTAGWPSEPAPEPEPPPPVLRPLELVIRDEDLGWVTLGYHPAWT